MRVHYHILCAALASQHPSRCNGISSSGCIRAYRHTTHPISLSRPRSSHSPFSTSNLQRPPPSPSHNFPFLRETHQPPNCQPASYLVPPNPTLSYITVSQPLRSTYSRKAWYRDRTRAHKPAGSLCSAVAVWLAGETWVGDVYTCTEPGRRFRGGDGKGGLGGMR